MEQIIFNMSDCLLSERKLLILYCLQEESPLCHVLLFSSIMNSCLLPAPNTSTLQKVTAVSERRRRVTYKILISETANWQIKHTHTHLFTLVRSFPSVHTAMLLHCTTWWEALAAEVTPIRLLPCESMRNHQCFGKRTLDQSYPEWNKVTCVRAHVYLQKCSAMELLVAMLTIVLFLALHLSRVCAQMLS